MIIEFTKMHGALNDFIVIDDRADKINVTADMAARMLNRRAGIGGDQLLLIRPTKEADFEMRIYNADGSEVEMCGNGMRCAALFAKKHGIVSRNEMAVKTLAGIKRPKIEGTLVSVDMGAPEFDGRAIPVNLDGEIINRPLDINGEHFIISCVSMGNPHCVIEVEDPDKFDVVKWGTIIERHALFPKRVNVEFIRVLDKKNIRMRVWERGSGETAACGTGACASAVICMRKGLTEREATVHLDGGPLKVRWPKDIVSLTRDGHNKEYLKDGSVFLIGPGVFVYEGKIEL
jgi:diaminopimelate epimerase